MIFAIMKTSASAGVFVCLGIVYALGKFAASLVEAAAQSRYGLMIWNGGQMI